jgi:predicted DNA binding CopG/RHH family protein
MGREPDVKVKLKKDEKKNTSLRLNGKTLKALKVRAIEEDTSVQKIIEQLIEDYLATPPKKQDK